MSCSPWLPWCNLMWSAVKSSQVISHQAWSWYLTFRRLCLPPSLEVNMMGDTADQPDVNLWWWRQRQPSNCEIPTPFITAGHLRTLHYIQSPLKLCSLYLWFVAGILKHDGQCLTSNIGNSCYQISAVLSVFKTGSTCMALAAKSISIK
jgi:hypothetical protein